MKVINRLIWNGQEFAGYEHWICANLARNEIENSGGENHEVLRIGKYFYTVPSRLSEALVEDLKKEL